MHDLSQDISILRACSQKIREIIERYSSKDFKFGIDIAHLSRMLKLSDQKIEPTGQGLTFVIIAMEPV